MRFHSLLALVCCTPLLAAPTVRFHTNLGDIDVELLSDSAPLTVANFLSYVKKGAYNNSMVHRSVGGFIWQGGGYNLINHIFVTTPQDAPVQNEYKVSNTRGTIAMAKVDGDPNSATNQWFFNEGDNSANLNNQNGGFTVFGKVANDSSLAVMDAISAVPVPTPTPYRAPFDGMPLYNWSQGKQVLDSNIVQVFSIAVPAEAGAVSASAFGGGTTITAGSFIEVYAPKIAGSIARQWGGSDFIDGKAPTELEGVTATVSGKTAFVNFVSEGQVNIQAPTDVPATGSAEVVVTYNGTTTAAVTLSLKALSPALLAPTNFKVGDAQYVAAFHASNNAVVSNGTIPDVPAAPAKAGETLIFYGTGFGKVKENVPVAGVLPQGATSLANAVQFKFGDTEAKVEYAGFAPGLVGVYQFNVVLPANTPSADVPVRVSQSGAELPQTLFLAVQN